MQSLFNAAFLILKSGTAVKAAQKQTDRAVHFSKLIAAAADAYSSIDGGDSPQSKNQRLRDVIYRITVQTIECGIFILQQMSGEGKRLDISSIPFQS